MCNGCFMKRLGWWKCVYLNRMFEKVMKDGKCPKYMSWEEYLELKALRAYLRSISTYE